MRDSANDSPAFHPFCMAALLCALSSWGCTGSGGPDGTALVGAGGGLVAVRDGPLSGTALQVPAGAVSGSVTLRIAPASAPAVDGFVPVGPAARFTPADLDLAAPATATLLLDPAHPEVAGNDPIADLVVLRVDEGGVLHVLPPSAFDLTEGRVQAESPGLGTFWAAVRPSAAPFALEDFLPVLDDWFSFSNQQDLLVRDASTDPNLGGAPWEAWELVSALPIQPITPGPSRPQHGFYFLPQGDGSTALLGWFERGVGFAVVREQVLAVEPLVLPAEIRENEVVERYVVLELYRPFGSTNPVRTSGTLRVSFGRRHAATVHAGIFGDVLEATVEFDMLSIPDRSLRLELARGVGPIVLEEFVGFPGELVWASARGRILE